MLTIDPYMIFYSPGLQSDSVDWYQGIHDPGSLVAIGGGIQEYGVTPMRYAATLLRDYPDLRQLVPNGLWSMAQLMRWEMGHREPRNDEIRLQVNLALTYGAKSIWYYPLHYGHIGLDSVYTPDPQHAHPGMIGLLNAVDPDIITPSPRRVNIYGEDKYHFVGDLNAKLHQLGPTLMTLTWDSAMSTHEWGVTSSDRNATNAERTARFTMYGGNLALADVTVESPDHVMETTHRKQYVEVGWHHGLQQAPGYTPEYLFVTNRQMTTYDLPPSTITRDGSRTIGLEFTTTHGGNHTYAVEDIYSGDIEVYRQGSVSYPYYSQTLPPGEGMLLRIDTGRWVADRTLGPGRRLTVHADDTLFLDDGALTIGDGAQLVIEGTLRIGPSARIVLDHGSISCNGGVLQIGNPAGLSGTGTVLSPHLELIDGFTLPTGSELTMSGGGEFECYDPNNPLNLNSSVPPISHSALTVQGTLRFTGPGQTYYFGSCVSSVTVYGRIETTSGVTLTNVPDLTGHGASMLKSGGSETSRNRWQFRSAAECNAYGTLEATQTIFEGGPLPGVRWAGILAAYDDAKLILDTCDLRDIDVIPSGAAVHLYAATSSSNMIRACHIYRATTDSIPRLGDGVFLQPYFDAGGVMGNPSYVRILCSTIDSSWWTGVADVCSDAEQMHTGIVGNRVGTSAGYIGIEVLHGVCIREHVGGCGVAVTNAHLMLGTPFPTNIAGENRIEENDTIQLLIGPEGYVVCSDTGATNVISHANASLQRVVMSAQAHPASLQSTWWGVVPDSTLTTFTGATQNALFGMAALPPGLLAYDPALRIDPYGGNCGGVCNSEDPVPPPVLRKGAGLPPYASTLHDLPQYARADNFHEVYRFLAQWVQQTWQSTPTTSCMGRVSAQAAGIALALERQHARRYPDSSAVCLGRVSGFVQARSLSVTDPVGQSTLQGIRARAILLFGDLNEAETRFSQLRIQYPTSRAAHDAAPYLLLLAMGQRDTATIESLVSGMGQGGYDAGEREIASGLRRGFYRALPRAAVAKRHAGVVVPDTSAAADNPLHARCYPNPFNPSVTIAYVLPEDDHVTVCVYALDGRKVATLVDGWQTAGAQRVVFDAPHGLPSGTYLYTITTSALHIGRHMVLLR